MTDTPKVEQQSTPYTPTPWHRNVSPAWKYPIYAEVGGDWAYVGSVMGAYHSRGKVTDAQVEGNLNLIVSSVNSYAKHCGPSAIQCAEDDLLGQALDILRKICEDSIECDMDDGPSLVDGLSWDTILDARVFLARLPQ